MPLLLSQLCDLLSALEGIDKHDPPFLPAKYQQNYRDIITNWFSTYRLSIYNTLVDPAVLLSALFPAKRTDRVYNHRITRLTKTLKRCLGLGVGRQKQLDQWQQPGRGDLGECVERVLQQAEFARQPASRQVTVQQVDDVLTTIASHCRHSGPKVRRASRADDDAKILDVLTETYHKLQSREAKWLTRMILKDYTSIDLDANQNLIFSCIDPRLTVAMQMYDDFEAAVTELRCLPVSRMADTAGGGLTKQCGDLAPRLSPRIGVKVGPPNWIKAKGGVRHAVSIIDGRTMSIERKHDGEYCQIHLDISKGDDCVQIFSKSGKDSTMDRSGVHNVIKDGLRVGQDDCGFSGKCILEGELLVWSDEIDDVLDFHKIRKHVSRSGSFLGTKEDSQYVPAFSSERMMLTQDRPYAHEHLMIMLYDVLLIDDSPVLHLPYSQRRRHLMQLVRPIKGRIGVIAQVDVPFSQASASKRLKKALAQAFVRRWEGLVLKPVHEPYFSLQGGSTGYRSRWIKMKKDCIRGLGDTADFAVVGASYDSKRAVQLGMPGLSWTHFFIGCMTNKHEVLHMDAKPEFLVVDCVTDCITKADFRTLNQQGKFVALDVKGSQTETPFRLNFVSMDPKLPRLRNIFQKPFVFEIAGSGFDKAANRKIFTLRFPRVLKIRWDRSWKEAVDLPELQAMGEEARMPPKGDLQDEVAAWVEKLDGIDQDSQAQTASWDSTDVRQGHGEPAVKDFATIGSESGRRSRTRNCPPLVRVDTQEVHTTERMLTDVEVAGRLTPIHPVTSNISLPTTLASSSSPKQRASNQLQIKGDRDAAVSPSTKRKRNSQAKITEGESQCRKRAKPGHGPHSGLTWTIESSSGRRGALQEIINSAQPSPTARSCEMRVIEQPHARNFEFVRKQAVDPHNHVDHRPRKLKREELPSSLGPQTTADERFTVASTQQLLSNTAASNSFSSPQERPADVSRLPTPLSTTDPPLLPEVPDLTKRVILLSSAFNADMATLAVSLERRRIRPRAFTDVFQKSRSPPGQARPEANKDVVMLIQSRNVEATTNDLVAIASQCRSWQPRSIFLWDHELVDVTTADQGYEFDQQDIVRRLFYARIWWATNERDTSVNMKIHWRSGDVDSISERGIACLRAPMQSHGGRVRDVTLYP